MANLGEKISYLKGLVQGLKIEGNDRLIMDAILDMMDELAQELADLTDTVEELQDDMDELADDLDDLVDELLDEDGDEDDSPEGYIEFICKECGRQVFFDIDSFDADDEHKCSCGAALLLEDSDE